MDLGTQIKSLSPAALNIFKRELPNKLATLDPQSRARVMSQLYGVPELRDLFSQPAVQPRTIIPTVTPQTSQVTSQVPLWQQQVAQKRDYVYPERVAQGFQKAVLNPMAKMEEFISARPQLESWLRPGTTAGAILWSPKYALEGLKLNPETKKAFQDWAIKHGKPLTNPMQIWNAYQDYLGMFQAGGALRKQYEEKIPLPARMATEMAIEAPMMIGGGMALGTIPRVANLPSVLRNVLGVIKPKVVIPDELVAGISRDGLTPEIIQQLKNLGYSDKEIQTIPIAVARTVTKGKPTIPTAEAGMPPVTPGVTPVTERVTPRVEPAIPETPTMGIPPRVPPTGPSLDTVYGMWQKGREPVKKVTDRLVKLQEQLNDIFYGLRKMQTRISSRRPILPGGKEDIITLLTRDAGVANAGATRYILTINEIKRIAPNISADDINAIIFANHAKEVLVEKGAERVMAGGFKTTQQLDSVLLELQNKLGQQNYNKAMRAAEIIKRVYTEERNRLVQEGLISKELGALFGQKYPWYNPLHYVEYMGEETIRGKSTRPFSVISAGLKRLSEKGTAKEAVTPLEVLGDQLIRNEVRIHRNQVAGAIIKLAQEDMPNQIKKISGIRPVAEVEGELVFRPYKGDIPGTLSYFANGVRQIYEVPDMIYREAGFLTESLANPISSFFSSLNGISRAAFTTFSPPFVVSNVLNDALTAFMTRGILPTQTAMRLLQSVRGFNSDKIMQAFRLSGGYQMRFYGRSAKELAREVGISSGKLIRTNESFFSKIKNAIPKAGELGEQAPRTALFKRELNKNLPNWKNMTPEEIAKTPQARKAAADAVELTINFGRGAYLIKAANPFVIFLNANMEGMKLPFRALKSNPNARWRLAAVSAGAMGLAGYNLSYPEYFDIPNSIRWSSLLVMLPSKEKDEYGNNKPNYVLITPRTREWGLFLGSMTYAMEKLYGDSPTDFGKFSATMAPQLFPIAEVPVPQVIGEILQQQANWDFYWSEPIVPRGLESLPKEAQVTSWTSRTIEEIANTIGVSPARAQHFANGIFGGVSQTATSVSDYILDLLLPKETDQFVIELANQYQSLKTDKERETFLSNIQAATQNEMFRYLRKPEGQVPVVSAITKRVYPQRGGQIRTTEYETMKPYKDIFPKYLESLLNGDQLKSLDLDNIKSIKGRDVKSIEKYNVTTEGMDDDFKKTYRQSNPEIDAALNLWGKVTTIQSEQAGQNLLTRLKALGIPDDAQYMVKKYIAYGLITGNYGGNSLEAKFYRIENPDFDAWGQKEFGWDTLNVPQGIKPLLPILRQYLSIEDTIWGSVPPELKVIAQMISDLEDTNPRQARLLQMQYPQLLYIRRQIAIQKKRMLLKYRWINDVLSLIRGG